MHFEIGSNIFIVASKKLLQMFTNMIETCI